jgi:polyisoprenoid-binding protein YceI
MLRFLSLNLIVLLGLSLAAQAAPVTYTIDNSHSTIGFKIRHLVSKVNGSFGDFSGKIITDEKSPTKSNVDVAIKSASIDTANAKRDEHLKSADFFDVAKHPEITFKTTKVTGTDKKFKIEGLLNLHGVEKPVVIAATSGGIAKDPWGKTRAGFSGTTKINRKDFGINWNKALDAGGIMLGDEVEISMDIEAVKDEVAAAK